MKIPKTWDKIPLENFIHFIEYQDEEPETVEDRFNLLYKRTCAILGCSVEDAKKLTNEDQQNLIRLIKKPLPTRLMLQFKHKGKRYRPIVQAKKLTGARYAAIKNLGARGLNDNLHQIMFLVCEPVKFGFKKKFPFIGWKPYEIKEEDIQERIEEFKTLPMEVVNPVSVFFLTLSKRLKDLLEDYSIQELMKMTDQMAVLQADLEKDTDGLRS